ncbi:hypothetical protein [Alcanivorax sp. 1008]|uniref:hypothetical protein n=1 Tax=Alcanivorax sp. 1008 TaxID=2816853 RepID=UPI001D715626|nr:hypothetical protein [Alcanivorax sp. 1008]MCC1498209.1 hypothetical protein [Alcanivorax sp. 1008]
MINRFISSLEALNSDLSEEVPCCFESSYGKAASWDDLVWYYVDPSTSRRTRFLCTIFSGRKDISDSSISKDRALPSLYIILFKKFLIRLCSEPVSAGYRQTKALAARKILSLQGPLHAIPDSAWAGEPYSKSFYEFCGGHGLVPSYLKPRWMCDDKRDRTGHNIVRSRAQKIPGEDVISAIGKIFCTSFGFSEEGFSRAKVACVSDALVSTVFLLCLASPNRAAAEIPILPNQRLKRYRPDKNDYVYYLDWRGSKGFGSYKNHVLRSLSAQVEVALEFFSEYCEPLRVLARFYEDQSLPLQELLGEFTIPSRRLKNINLARPANLFVLGYALGFYEDNLQISVVEDEAGIISCPVNSGKKRRFLCRKNIWELDYGHKVWISKSTHSAFHDLLILPKSSTPPEGLVGVLSLGDLEAWWLDYFKSVFFPSFPNGFSKSEQFGRVRNLMFVFSSRQLNMNSPGNRKYAKSAFAILEPKTLFSHVSTRAGYSKNLSSEYSIFVKHGYPDYRIRLHDFRHYANTVGYESDIGVEILSAWSGRKDVKQTYEYIHTSPSDIAGMVREVFERGGDPECSDSLFLSVDEISHLAKLPASITSTGICVQDLNITPCIYLNDFVSQCFMCSSSCHIAGDNESIEFLKKDAELQARRLDLISADPRFASSSAMKSWFHTHDKNVQILGCLVKLMEEREPGSVIKFSRERMAFSISLPDGSKFENLRIQMANFGKDKPSDQSCLKMSYDRGENNEDLKNVLGKFGLKCGG